VATRGVIYVVGRPHENTCWQIQEHSASMLCFAKSIRLSFSMNLEQAWL
jgi:hypothetical protein